MGGLWYEMLLLQVCRAGKDEVSGDAREASSSSAYGSELSTNMTIQEGTRGQTVSSKLESNRCTGNQLCQHNGGNNNSSLTLLRNIQPDTIFVEGILVRKEPIQAASAILSSPRALLVHRGILLVPKHDPVTGPTLSRAAAALRAYRLLLVAFQLPTAAGEAVRSTTNVR